jgi:hypothetical protein
MALNTITLVTIVTLATAPADLTARREHVAVTEDVATSLGIPVPLTDHFQVRVAVTAPASANTNTANFTVAAIIPGANQVALYPSTSATATNGGIYKLFNSNTLPAGAKATLYDQAPSSTTVDGAAFGSSFTEPGGASKSFKEIVTTGSSAALIFAPHGGNIEEETSVQLATLKSRLNVLGHTPAVWDAQGLWGSGQTFRRWHVTAPDVNPESFPGLDHLVGLHGTFPRAVALHGFTWNDESATNSSTWRYGIVIGGRASVADKQAVMNAIVAQVGANQISFAIADPAGDLDFPNGPNGSVMAASGYSGLRGVATDNVLNVLSPTGGIQLEQSRGVRETYKSQVATGVANALSDLLSSSLALDEDLELVKLP